MVEQNIYGETEPLISEDNIQETIDVQKAKNRSMETYLVENPTFEAALGKFAERLGDAPVTKLNEYFEEVHSL